MNSSSARLKRLSVDQTPESRELMTVSQLASVAGEPPHAVRYYCRIGMLSPSAVSAGGYRLFDELALYRLRFIRLAQGLGFTLEEIGGFIRHSESGAEPCPEVMSVLSRRLPQIGLDLAQLETMHARMVRAQARWEHMDHGAPTGYEICRLIESENEL